MNSVRNAIEQLSPVWLRALLILAIVLAAFAHRPLAGEPPALELARFVLPDGTLPDLCLNGDESGKPAGHKHAFCDFCVVAGSSAHALPVTDTQYGPLPLELAILLPQSDAPPVATIDLATASLRGPPSVFV